MEVHKPKPAHSWRELASEIGVIVVGVLIALSAEQAVDTLHWRHKVAEAEAAMRLELVDDDLPQAYVRAAIAPCLGAQLDALRAAIRPGMKGQAFAALADDYLPPLRTWDAEAWRLAQASDVGTHMPPERMIKWGNAYTMVPSLGAMADRERAGLHELARTRDRRGTLSAADAGRLLDAADDLASANVAIAGQSFAMLLSGEAIGMSPPQAAQARLLADARRTYGACVVKPDWKAFERLNSDVSSKAVVKRVEDLARGKAGVAAAK